LEKNHTRQGGGTMGSGGKATKVTKQAVRGACCLAPLVTALSS